MSKTKTKFVTADDYLVLVRRFPLRPIRSEAEYDRAIEILKEFIAHADGGMTAGEQDYVDALEQFVGVYEEGHYQIEKELRTPLRRLKYLMEQQGLNAADLAKLLGSGTGQTTSILNGNRELSKTNIRALANRFKVSPGLFL